MDRSGPRAAHPRPDDPTDRDAFRTYIDHTVATVLERNSTTDLLIELDRHPMPPPPELRVPRWLWNVPAVPVAALLRLTTAGYLPPVLRPRLGVEWSPGRPPAGAGGGGAPTTFFCVPTLRPPLHVRPPRPTPLSPGGGGGATIRPPAAAAVPA
ncbi:oxygenase MpaB family protein, partial [Nocardia carnea]|uniref:oxygenase MpaB family protein n=1 Tax=Nocardia carnea TaxID=37328 RepID=UPI003D7A724D